MTATPQPPRAAPRPRPRGRLLRFLAIALVLLVSPIFVLAATVAATGTVTVAVHDRGADGINLWLPVPALLIDLAAVVGPQVIPQDALDEIRREVAPYRALILEAVRQLEDCPNGVLVEVVNRNEHVVVRKTHGRFQVTVDSIDLDVRVSVPDRVARRALQAAGIV